MQPAENAVNGTPEPCAPQLSAPPSDSPASPVCWEQLFLAIQGLTAAILRQSEAIDALAASNEAIVDALPMPEQEEEEEPQRYMDGTPMNGKVKGEH